MFFLYSIMYLKSTLLRSHYKMTFDILFHAVTTYRLFFKVMI